ncbi:MAG: pyrimidine dimer DNA glycosylase/endonuclease V [Candidatus Margulisiibacteriota bacterium]
MRLWSLHPCYLDQKGLTALWRESLLARKVLMGQTRGYKNHPQLLRFRSRPDPIAAINTYLQAVYDESVKRGYKFDKEKLSETYNIVEAENLQPIPVTRGQLEFEGEHLRQKLLARSPKNAVLPELGKLRPHPLFNIIPGDIAEWERL